MAYPYQPLQSGEIRVLELTGGRPEDELICELRHVSLSSDAAYEALSYTWGSTTEAASITCSNITVAVTGNLHAALKHIRKSNATRVLWIDQLCINQTDIPERNEQVKLMGQVYQRAVQVIIWIGEEDEQSQMAFTFLPDLVEMTSRPQEGILSKLERFMKSGGIAVIRSPAWFALSSVFARQWFRRMWVIQELVYARRVHVICGRWIITWEDLVFASELISGQDEDGAAHENVAFMDSLREAFQSSGQKKQLLDLLFHCYEFQSTDARDKIFAAMGLSCNISRPELSPDYAQSVGDIYINATKHFIEAQGILDVLCCVFHPHNIAGLPSWCSDWSCNPGVRQRFGTPEEPPNPSSSQLPRISADSRLIFLRGRVVDTVKKLGVVYSTREYLKALVDWEALAKAAVNEDQPSHHCAYRQTLLASDDDEDSQKDQRDAKLYAAWTAILDTRLLKRIHEPNTLNKGVDIHELNDRSIRFQHDMEQMCVGRKIALTGQNHLGLVPANAQEDDLVCIFHQCPAPVVLRKGSVNERHSLVGACYLQGFKSKISNIGEEHDFILE